MVGLQHLEEHAHRRRPCTRGPGTAALKNYEHLTARRVRQLSDTLGRQGETLLDKSFDHFAWVYYLWAAVAGNTDVMLEHRYDLMRIGADARRRQGRHLEDLNARDKVSMSVESVLAR